MAQINRVTMDLATAKRLEVAAAQADKTNAQLQYVAMMTDIELPDEEAEKQEENDGTLA